MTPHVLITEMQVSHECPYETFRVRLDILADAEGVAMLHEALFRQWGFRRAPQSDAHAEAVQSALAAADPSRLLPVVTIQKP